MLSELGVPKDRESEIDHLAEIEPGRHEYGGWFHFIGRIASGPDCFVGDASGGTIQREEISTHFSVGFTKSRGLVPPSFPSGSVGQIEFGARVPWVLDEPFPR